MVKNLLRCSNLVCKALAYSCYLCALILSFIPLNAIDYTIPYYPWKIDTCDINNDGHRDLITLATGGLGYMQNNGDGTFAPYEIIIPGDVLIVACCQLDEAPGDDIAVLRCYSGDEPIQFEYYFNGNFVQPLIVPFPNSMTIYYTFTYEHGDFNNDNREDIVLTGFIDPSTNNKYWCYMYNLGNQQFANPVWVQCLNTAYGNIIVGDYNEDGVDDIAFNDSSIVVYYSTGNGFTYYVALPAYHCATLTGADIDQDGDIDLMTNSWEGGWTNHHRYLENIPGLSFIIHEQYFQHHWGASFMAELNGDCYPDIVSMIGGSSTFAIFYNLHNWTMDMSEVTIPTYGENTHYCCLDRYDNNNSFDIAFTRDTATQNNLTIIFNDGSGNFVNDPVSLPDEVLPNISNQINCYPNPCKDFVYFKVNYHNHYSSYTIYNIKGQTIRHLYSQEQVFQWDLTDDNGIKVVSGIYLIRSENGNSNQVSKFIILN